MSLLALVSALLGWIYTILWSLSFWPQTILNYRRKSSTGFSIDFAHLNLIGFISYSIYNVAFLISTTIQQQYQNRHHGSQHVVRWNDAIFALHGFALTAVQVGQIWFYPREPGQGLSRFAKFSLGGIALVIAAGVLLVLPGGGHHGLQYLDLINLFSYIKLYITLVKYIPQVVLNSQRKSTSGFSIEAILLDFSGGVLSLLQLVIDAGLIQHDWTGVTGDFGKLCVCAYRRREVEYYFPCLHTHQSIPIPFRIEACPFSPSPLTSFSSLSTISSMASASVATRRGRKIQRPTTSKDHCCRRLGGRSIA